MNKRVCSILFVIVMLLGLCACGNKKDPGVTSEPVVTPAPEPTAEPTPEPTPIPGVVILEQPVQVASEDFEMVSEMEEELVETAEQEDAPVDPVPEETVNGTDTEIVVVTPETEADKPADLDIGYVPNSTAFEQYNNMSGDAQLAYMESFDSIESFVAWYNAALAEYEAVSNPIEITDGVIDLGELIGE